MHFTCFFEESNLQILLLKTAGILFLGHLTGNHALAQLPTSADEGVSSSFETEGVPPGSALSRTKTPELADSPDRRYLAVASRIGIVVWNNETKIIERVIVGHMGYVRSVAWSSDGERIASGAEDRTVKIWEAASGRLLQTLEGATGSVLSLQWSPDGAHVAGSTVDGTIKIWQVDSGAVVQTLTRRDGSLSGVGWPHSSEEAATIREDPEVQVSKAMPPP